MKKPVRVIINSCTGPNNLSTNKNFVRVTIVTNKADFRENSNSLPSVRPDLLEELKICIISGNSNPTNSPIIPFPIMKGEKTTIFKFMGDSTWDGKKYMKVYMTTDSSLVKWDVHGLIREDSTHKVFYKSPDKEQEELMYDFNAKIGDSLFIPPNFVDDPILVCSIDTVELGGVKRKRYKLARQFCSDQPQDLWIEGIGSLLGILNSNRVGAIGVYISLLCFYENDKASNRVY